jgi:hypothetical protein
VTRRVNDRFGTAFAEFEPTERNTSRCFELIKLRGTLSPVLLGFESGTVTAEDLLPKIAALARRGNEPGTPAAWVPYGERDRSKAALREQWERPALASLRARAQQVYHAFRRPQ